ncbi:Cinnamyl alcohol dehydrogenase (fragment) [Pseudomonas sp. 8Z]|uniref:hypothetical protein n=1 Tax=Pseudomonas sp. 8Z TaxID=2653166 RepID=UPI0012EF236A
MRRSESSDCLFILDEMLRRYFLDGIPAVDVRKVAQAHITAASNRSAQGRYILAEKRMLSFGIFRPQHR